VLALGMIGSAQTQRALDGLAHSSITAASHARSP
jgi:hypothetical protein